MKVSKKGSSVRRAFFMLVPVQKLFSEYFQKLSIRAVFYIRLYGEVKAFCAGVLCRSVFAPPILKAILQSGQTAAGLWLRLFALQPRLQ